MDINRNKKGLHLHYVVHPMVFEFITCKSIEDNFITVIDYSQSTVALTEKIRRLSLHFGSATYASIPESMARSQIRSLSFMGLLNCMPSLADFELVRVVILHVLVDNGDKSFPLTGIGGLLFLRYLQVRCNVTVELPEEIGCLKHLETLEIQRVAAIPSEIVRLESFKMKRFDRIDGEYDPFLKKKNWIHEMGLSNERDDVVKILHAVSKEDLSDDRPAGVVGKMPGDDALSNDQPGGVLGKMTWEDDFPNDQPGGVLGEMLGDDALSSNDQPGGVLGKMTWEDGFPNDQPGVLGEMPGDDALSSNDQPGGVLGKMTWEDDFPSDQPGGVLGKMTWEDDLPNDQPARVLGKMPWEDDLSNDQPGGVLGNMEGEYMNKYDAYTRVMELASKRAVVVFTLSSCVMSHTVRRLMADLGVNPLVHELDSDPSGKELERALLKMLGGRRLSAVPAVFIGGTDRVMSLHLAGELVPMLRDAAALWAVVEAVDRRRLGVRVQRLPPRQHHRRQCRELADGLLEPGDAARPGDAVAEPLPRPKPAR
ncbi:hypothetical protein PVAP13_2NG113984 [Panicum virgatum]|uniref:Glutaredoxin domain-containing protein n=2 Tax=Panicum virgatum TaxID=38727 RepID=A0A8T0V9J7_PANVG|nr:hypothetical protein PVAP13_2NG113984 [Panicum virgatum]